MSRSNAARFETLHFINQALWLAKLLRVTDSRSAVYGASISKVNLVAASVAC